MLSAGRAQKELSTPRPASGQFRLAATITGEVRPRAYQHSLMTCLIGLSIFCSKNVDTELSLSFSSVASFYELFEAA